LRGSGTNCGQTQIPRRLAFLLSAESPHR